MRQPWLFANSRISSSDMSRRTRNSAGWVTTYSELIESLSPILAARAGKSMCIFSLLTIICAIRVGDLFLQWQRWRLLRFTVHSGSECVNSFATRRRATRSWFFHDLARCRSFCVKRIRIKFTPGHKRYHNSFRSLARCFSLAKLCRCFRRRSSYAATLLIR
jgi:hypothetical protein